MFSIQKKGPKYDVSSTVRYPICEDDIQVGTAGLRGLEQHQGKKKCLATISKKKQDERSAKNLTSFKGKTRESHCLQQKLYEILKVGTPRAHLVSLSTLYP
jgi:hypothetical protein